MGTAEIIIVFSALMALVALVTIGIDWIAKPLKHRRFIPRMYRFEDEKLPIDAYGHTDFAVEQGPPAMQPVPMQHMPQPQMPQPQMQPAPMVVAQLPTSPAAAGAAATVAVPVAVARSTSAFSDSLAATTSGSTPAITTAATSSAAPMQPLLSGTGWAPGMPLDATIDDRKPNLATKAQRFWIETAAGLLESHFDSDNVGRMQAGKAPNRRNPRSGRTESMQLSGLRKATRPSDVQMTWADDAIDPWSTS